jgi:tryptophan 2,3-dioxygenase
VKVAVHLKARQGQVVGAWGVLADLQDTEETEAFESMMVVVVHVYLEGARATNLAEFLNNVITSNVKLLVAWKELASV